MRDESRTNEPDEAVEDLDVGQVEAEGVKGGDKTAPTKPRPRPIVSDIQITQTIDKSTPIL
jgi:hypothetical protein